MLKEEKQAIMAEYATHEGDTGSPEVQIALLTKRTSQDGWSEKKPSRLPHKGRH